MMKKTFFSYVFFLLSSLLLVNTALADGNNGSHTATLGLSPSNANQNTENKGEAKSLPDPFGRDTPRGTVLGFIKALAANDPLLAGNYLNLSETQNAPEMVRKFQKALDTGGTLDSELKLSNKPEGNLTDNLPPNQEMVGDINIDDQMVSLLLEKIEDEEGKIYWQFSQATLNKIPYLLSDNQETKVDKYTIQALKGKYLFGYKIADMMAVVILAAWSFLFVYILLWIIFLSISFLYPRVKNKHFPIDSKVILPLSVVLASFILNGVMLRAGVSVVVRDAVSRVTDISLWVALTWLAFRIVDVGFKRAEHLSYKYNRVERLSVIGLVRKVVKLTVLFFAAILIFGNLGYDLTTGIAALGVGGLALALGAQKTVENLVGSVVVVADQPVRVGDYCRFDKLEGTVIDIGIRSTTLRTLNRTVVTVPNGDFSSMMIENYTARDMFRFLHNIYLKRDADIDIIDILIADLEKFLIDNSISNQQWNQVYLAELRQDCYVITVQAYINAISLQDFYTKQTELLVELLNKIATYDVEHALPTQKLVIDNKVNDMDDVKDDDLQ